MDDPASDFSRKSAYPLSRAYIKRPKAKAMASATALLPKVPCCLKSFKNKDSRNSDPVMPVTKPAMQHYRSRLLTHLMLKCF